MEIDETIERATWDLFWVPPGVLRVDRPEILYLSSARPTPTLNVVPRIRPEDEGHAAALVREVAAAHAGGPSRYQITQRSCAGLLRPELESAGYALAHEHDAMAVPIERFTPRPAANVEVRRVTDLARLKDNVAVSEAAFEIAAAFLDTELMRQLRECTAPGCRVHRFVAYDTTTGAPVSAGNFNAFPELGLAFFWGGGTLATARGRGAYSALVAARVAHARAHGLRTAGLYARLRTSAPIVQAQGFQRYGRMEFWDRECDTSAPCTTGTPPA